MTDNENTNKNKKYNSMESRTTIRVANYLANEVNAICHLYGGSISSRTHELLTDWKIEMINHLKSKAPDMYEKYLAKLNELNTKN